MALLAQDTASPQGRQPLFQTGSFIVMSLVASFAGIAAERPKQVALITERSQMTYADLLGMVQILDLQLSARGVRQGQTVVLASSRAEFTLSFALLLSLRALQVIYAPIGAVQEAGVAFDWAISTEPMPSVPPERQIIMDGGWFAALGTLPPPDYTSHQATSGGAFLTPTSGSTGIPKFVAVSETQRLYRIEKRHGFVDTDMSGRRLAITMSPANLWGLTSALSILLGGGSVIMLTSDQERLPSYIDLYRADALSTTPTILAQMTKLDGVGQFFSGLRDIRIGGALAARAIVDSVGLVTSARLHFGYGAAEIGMVFGFIHDRETPQPEGFLGRPVRDDLDILFHDETGHPLPPGATEGAVGFRLRNRDLQRRYLATETGEPTAELNETFLPGDVLRRDALGYHYIGRTKNIVNFSGEKYSLDQIAAHLATAFDGRLVVPLVETDADGLERIAVVTAGDQALDTAAVEAALSRRFELLKVARCVVVPQFPMTATGKVDTVALKAMIA